MRKRAWEQPRSRGKRLTKEREERRSSKQKKCEKEKKKKKKKKRECTTEAKEAPSNPKAVSGGRGHYQALDRSGRKAKGGPKCGVDWVWVKLDSL
jgi:hypothetical protein